MLGPPARREIAPTDGLALQPVDPALQVHALEAGSGPGGGRALGTLQRRPAAEPLNGPQIGARCRRGHSEEQAGGEQWSDHKQNVAPDRLTFQPQGREPQNRDRWTEKARLPAT